uniref:Transmembrane protein n=1 Tax=Neospora caninum (strain Liverpool) TaxID=572307 RepID=A0A0F7UHN2_NEOCL|nr:TPA: hypothetical protein BN1204_051930 [Neospora caninum Liverpool]
MDQPKQLTRPNRVMFSRSSLLLQKPVGKTQGGREEGITCLRRRSRRDVPAPSQRVSSRHCSHTLSVFGVFLLCLCLASLSFLPLSSCASHAPPTGSTGEIRDSETDQNRLPAEVPEAPASTGLRERGLSLELPCETEGDRGPCGEALKALEDNGRKATSVEEGYVRRTGEASGEAEVDGKSSVEPASPLPDTSLLFASETEQEIPWGSRGTSQRETGADAQPGIVETTFDAQGAVETPPSRSQSDGVEKQSTLLAGSTSAEPSFRDTWRKAFAAFLPWPATDSSFSHVHAGRAAGASASGRNGVPSTGRRPVSPTFSTPDAAVTLIDSRAEEGLEERQPDFVPATRESGSGETGLQTDTGLKQGLKAKKGDEEAKRGKESKEKGSAGKELKSQEQRTAGAKQAEREKERDRRRATGKRDPEQKKPRRVQSESPRFSAGLLGTSRTDAVPQVPPSPGSPGTARRNTADKSAKKPNQRRNVLWKRRRHSWPSFSVFSFQSSPSRAPASASKLPGAAHTPASGALGASHPAPGASGRGDDASGSMADRDGFPRGSKGQRASAASGSPKKGKGRRRAPSDVDSAEREEKPKPRRERKQDASRERKKSRGKPSGPTGGAAGSRRRRERTVKAQARRQPNLQNQAESNDRPPRFASPASLVTVSASVKTGRSPAGRNSRHGAGAVEVEVEGRVSVPESPVPSVGLSSPSPDPRRRRRGVGHRDVRYGPEEAEVVAKEEPSTTKAAASVQAELRARSGTVSPVPRLQRAVVRRPSGDEETTTDVESRRRWWFAVPGRNSPTRKRKKGSPSAAERVLEVQQSSEPAEAATAGDRRGASQARETGGDSEDGRAAASSPDPERPVETANDEADETHTPRSAGAGAPTQAGDEKTEQRRDANLSGPRRRASRSKAETKGTESERGADPRTHTAAEDGGIRIVSRDAGTKSPEEDWSRSDETEPSDEPPGEKHRGRARQRHRYGYRGETETPDNSDDGPGDHFGGPPGDGVGYLFSPENHKRLCLELFHQPKFAEMFVVLFLHHLRWPSYTQQEGGTGLFFKTLQKYAAGLVDGQSPAMSFSLLRDCPLHEIINQVIASLSLRIKSRRDLHAFANEMTHQMPRFFAYSLAYTPPASKSLRTAWGFFAAMVVVWEVFATAVLREELFGLSAEELSNLQKTDPFFWAALAEGLLDVWSMQRSVNTSLLWTYMTVSSIIDTGPTSRVQNAVGILLLEDVGNCFLATTSPPFPPRAPASRDPLSSSDAAQTASGSPTACTLSPPRDLSGPAGWRVLQEFVEAAIHKKLEQAVDKRVAPVAGCRPSRGCFRGECGNREPAQPRCRLGKYGSCLPDSKEPNPEDSERAHPTTSASPFIQYSSCETLWRRAASHLPSIQVTGFYMRRNADPRAFFPRPEPGTEGEFARRSPTGFAATPSSPPSAGSVDERGVAVGDFGNEVPQAILDKMKAELPAGGVLVQMSLLDAWGSEWFASEPHDSGDSRAGGSAPHPSADDNAEPRSTGSFPRPFGCLGSGPSSRFAAPVYVPATTAMELFRVDLSVDPSLDSVRGRVSALAVEVIGIDSIDLFRQNADPREDPDVHVYLSIPEDEFGSDQKFREEIYAIVSGQPSVWVAAAMKSISWDRIQILGTARWTGVLPAAARRAASLAEKDSIERDGARETRQAARRADAAPDSAEAGAEHAGGLARRLHAEKAASTEPPRRAENAQADASASEAPGGNSSSERSPDREAAARREPATGGGPQTGSESGSTAGEPGDAACVFGTLQKTRGFGRRFERSRAAASTSLPPPLHKAEAKLRHLAPSVERHTGEKKRRKDDSEQARMYGSDDVLTFGWQPGHRIVHVFIEGLGRRVGNNASNAGSEDDLILEMPAEEAKVRLTRRIRGRDIRVVHVHLDHRNIELAGLDTHPDHPRSEDEEDGVPIVTAVLTNVFLALFMIVVLTCLHLAHKNKKGPFWLRCCCGGEFPWLSKKDESKAREKTGPRSERSLEAEAAGSPSPPKESGVIHETSLGGDASPNPHLQAEAVGAAEADASTYGASQPPSLLCGSTLVSPRESLVSLRGLEGEGQTEADEEAHGRDGEMGTASPASSLRTARSRASLFSDGPPWRPGECTPRSPRDAQLGTYDEASRPARFRGTSPFATEATGSLASRFAAPDKLRTWDAGPAHAGLGPPFGSPRRVGVQRSLSAADREDSIYSTSIAMSSSHSSSSSSVEIYDSTPSLRRSASCRASSHRFSIRESLSNVHLRWNYFSARVSSPTSADGSVASDGLGRGRRCKR